MRDFMNRKIEPVDDARPQVAAKIAPWATKPVDPAWVRPRREVKHD